MAEGVRRKKKGRPKKTKSERYFKYGWPGLLAGLVLGIMLMNSLSPGRMIVTKKSSFGFDRTVVAIEGAISDLGLKHMGTVDTKKKLGTGFRAKVIRLLHPGETGSALDADRGIVCIVPTTIAVYEDEDLNIYISYLRPSWARKIFGDRTGEVLGSIVKEALAEE